MKKIKKLIIAGVVVLVLLIVGVVLFIDRIAKAGTEQGATFALGTQTTLNSANIALVAGRSELQTLQVNNPPGFETSHFLKLDKGALAVSLGSLTGDTVEVSEFTLDGIDVNLEKKGANSNYQVILDHLKRFESDSAPQAKEEKKEGKRFIIREIVIRNVKVHVKLAPLGATLVDVTVPVNEIRLKNVGADSDKGVIIAELTDALIKSIIMAAIEQGGNLIPKEILGDLNTAIASLTSLKDIGATLAVNVDGVVKDLSGQAAKTVQQVTQQAAKTAQAATQEASKAVEEASKKATENAAKGIGDLLKKPEEKKPK
jgi:hypothetical protein